MKKLIVLEAEVKQKRGKVARKGQSVKPVSSEEFPYTEEEILDASYNASKSVWSKYRNMFRNVEYTEDDFIQDSMMHILKLYRNNYFYKSDSKTNDNLYNLIWTLLNGHFINNKVKLTRKELKTYYHEEPVSDSDVKYGGKYDTSNHSYVGQIASDALDPSQVQAKEELFSIGKDLFMNICDSFDVTSYGRDLNLTGYEPILGKIRFNESTMAKLIGMGYSRKEVQEIYGVTELGHKQQIISRKYTAVTNRLRDILSKLDKDSKEAVSVYLDSQEAKAE